MIITLLFSMLSSWLSKMNIYKYKLKRQFMNSFKEKSRFYITVMKAMEKVAVLLNSLPFQNNVTTFFMCEEFRYRNK